MKSKAFFQRATEIYPAKKQPDYLSDRDPGADLADAIGLGVWWLKEMQVNE